MKTLYIAVIFIFICSCNSQKSESNKAISNGLSDSLKTIIINTKSNSKMSDDDLNVIIDYIIKKLSNDKRYNQDHHDFEINGIDVINDKSGAKISFSYDFGTGGSLRNVEFHIINHKISDPTNNTSLSLDFLSQYPAQHRTLFDINHQENKKEEEEIKNRVIKLVGQEYFNYMKNSSFQESHIKDGYYIELDSKVYNDIEKEFLLIIDMKNNIMQCFIVNGSDKKTFADNFEVFPIVKAWLKSPSSDIDGIMNSTNTVSDNSINNNTSYGSNNNSTTELKKPRHDEISYKLEYARMTGDEMRKKYSDARNAYLNENSPLYGDSKVMLTKCNFIFGEMKGLRNNLLNFYNNNRSDFDPTLTQKMKNIMDGMDGWIAVREEELKY